MTNYADQVSIIPENEIDKYIYHRYATDCKDKLDQFICNYNDLLHFKYIELACTLNDDNDFFIMEHNRQKDKTILTFKDIRDNTLHTHKVSTVTHFTNPTYMYCYGICRNFMENNLVFSEKNFDYFKVFLCTVEKVYQFAIDPTAKNEVIEYPNLFEITCSTVENPNKTVGDVKTFTFRGNYDDSVYYLPSSNLLKELVKANSVPLTSISIDDDGNDSYSYWVSNERYMDYIGWIADYLTKYPDEHYVVEKDGIFITYTDTYTIVGNSLIIDRKSVCKVTSSVRTEKESYPI